VKRTPDDTAISRFSKEKLKTLVASISEKKLLETMGKELSVEQIQDLLDWAASQNNIPSREAINALFIGIPQSAFSKILMQASPKQLDFLRHESFIETIQHHLSQLSHELKEQFNVFCGEMESKAKALQTVDVSDIQPEEIRALYNSLQTLSQQGKEIIHLVACTLALAWNTNRVDLIQELSRVKELCQHCLNKDVGASATDSTPSSGLWGILEKRLNLVFSDIDTKGDVIVMKDTDFALEALVKFSVWHLRDYCDVGLLPQTDEEIPAGGLILIGCAQI